MTVATIKLAGVEAREQADSLYRALAQAGVDASPPQVFRDGGVIALISLGLSAIGTAKTIWDWWNESERTPKTVHIVLPDGSEVNLATSSLDEITVKLAPSKHQS